MSRDTFLGYRGQLRDVVGVGSGLVWVTEHPEQHPTAVYSLDAAKLALHEQPLPTGGVAVAVSGRTLKDAFVWVAGSDGQVYHGSLDKPLKSLAEFPAGSLTTLLLITHENADAAPADENSFSAGIPDCLAVLSGKSLCLLDLNGKPRQQIELPAAGTCLAVDPTGDWLVVGMKDGGVSVFTREDDSQASESTAGNKDRQFTLSEHEQLHKSAVTALLFEPEELRFFSAGKDQKLLLTHARGRLEPEDRGRSYNHDKDVTGMLLAPGDRLLTGGRDGTLKSWVRSGGTRPSTTKDDVAGVISMTRVNVHNRLHIACACRDNTLRLFLVDAAGKVGQLTHKLHDALAKTEHELGTGDVKQREAVLKQLAGIGDKSSWQIIVKSCDNDTDAAVRKLAGELLAASDHPQAASWLEPLLDHKDDNVRLTALDGLRRLYGVHDLRPLDLALKTARRDVALAAVSALEEVGAQDEFARTRLQQALGVKLEAVRLAAARALESVYNDDDPQANLLALKANDAVLRKFGLVRLLQRDFLANGLAQAAIRQAYNDDDPGVRQIAFLVTVRMSPALTTVVSANDAELARLLTELDSEIGTGVVAAEETDNKKSAKKKSPKRKTSKKKSAADTDSLQPADYEPLLQALSSRSADVSLSAAVCLAQLQDTRAYPVLQRLCRTKDLRHTVAVCQAFGALGDVRALDTLRNLISHYDDSVRDAAYSAVLKVLHDSPKTAILIGLRGVIFPGAGDRAIELLTKLLRAELKHSGRIDMHADGLAPLLKEAINAESGPTRLEACKVILNENVCGDKASTLAFVMTSEHEDVRKQVSTEVMAQIREPWAMELLYRFLNDSRWDLRHRAFEFALKQPPRENLALLEKALLADRHDIRKVAVDQLVAIKSKAAQKLLATAIADKHKDVRQAAIAGLIDLDAVSALRDAMASEFTDVRLAAAVARARLGDATSLSPLRELLNVPQPENEAEQKLWIPTIVAALNGLGELGDASAASEAIRFLHHELEEFSNAAADALVGMATPKMLPVLENLKCRGHYARARLVLARWYAGNGQVVAPMNHCQPNELLAALAVYNRYLRWDSPGYLHESYLGVEIPEAISQSFFLLLLLEDHFGHDGTPRHILNLLSWSDPKIRLKGAAALEYFGDAGAMAKFIAYVVNEHRDSESNENHEHRVDVADVANISAVLQGDNNQLKARLVQKLPALFEERPDAWKFAWQQFVYRYGDEFTHATAAVSQRKLPDVSVSLEERRQLAFGTYVGLLGENDSGSVEHTRARRTAVDALAALAARDESYVAPTQAVLLTALGDSTRRVRERAFETLVKLQTDVDRLSIAAVESGQSDMGLLGLELITKDAGKAESARVLEQVMLSRTDDLAVEAMKLLREHHDPVRTAKLALDAALPNLGVASVNWLAAAVVDTELPAKTRSAAEKELIAATKCRQRALQVLAAESLARRQHKVACETLGELLQTSRDKAEQTKLIRAVGFTRDAAAATLLLDRLQDTQGPQLPAQQVIQTVGLTRDVTVVARLLRLLREESYKSNRPAIVQAVLTISGYDQRWPVVRNISPQHIVDGCGVRTADGHNLKPTEADLKAANAESKVWPHHDDVLAMLMDTCNELGLTSSVRDLLPSAVLALTNAVDPVLATLSVSADDSLRHQSLCVIGWRAVHRGGPVEPLLAALSHGNPVTQFFAAEGLALAGRKDGVSVLLAGIELLTDPVQRDNALRALGELGEERAFDRILQLAQEDGHALQETATEMLGHWGRSDKADEILELLQKRLTGSWGLVAHAMHGLRRFDTPAGWELLRSMAVSVEHNKQRLAIELLKHNDTQATREFLLKLCETGSPDTAVSAWYSARELFGDDAAEPDVALVRNRQTHGGMELVQPTAFRRIIERVPATELLPLAEFVGDRELTQLTAIVLRAEEVPLEPAVQLLESRSPVNVELTARVLGRATSASNKGVEKSLLQTLQKWLQQWNATRQAEQLGRTVALSLGVVTHTTARLAYAAGQLRCGQAELVQALDGQADIREFLPIRRTMLTALATMFTPTANDKKAAASKVPGDVLQTMTTQATSSDFECRRIAREFLAATQPKTSGTQLVEWNSQPQLVTRVLDVVDQKTQTAITAAVAEAAGSVHRQGVMLPVLVERGERERLAGIVEDSEHDLVVRSAAVEALARLADEAAEQALAGFGNDEKLPEELRKLAWRCRRRSVRRRQVATV